MMWGWKSVEKKEEVRDGWGEDGKRKRREMCRQFILKGRRRMGKGKGN